MSRSLQLHPSGQWASAIWRLVGPGGHPSVVRMHRPANGRTRRAGLIALCRSAGQVAVSERDTVRRVAGSPGLARGTGQQPVGEQYRFSRPRISLASTCDQSCVLASSFAKLWALGQFCRPRRVAVRASPPGRLGAGVRRTRSGRRRRILHVAEHAETGTWVVARRTTLTRADLHAHAHAFGPAGCGPGPGALPVRLVSAGAIGLCRRAPSARKQTPNCIASIVRRLQDD